MRMTMSRDALLHAAQVAAKVAAKGDTREMSCVLVEAEGGAARFSATDGDRAVSHGDVAMVDEPGACLVPAPALARIVKSMRDGAVTLSATARAATVEGGGSIFEVPALDPADWQGAPPDCEGPACRVGAGELAAMAKRVAPFCADKRESSDAMRGVHVEFDGAALRMRATDSYRVCEASALAEGDGPFDAICPREFAVQAAEAMSGEVEVTSDGRRVVFSCGPTRMSTRAVAAKYYDVSRMWPKSPAYELDVSRADLAGMLGRAAQLGSGSFPVALDAAGGSMSARVDGKDAGRFEESVPCGGEFSGVFDVEKIRSCVDAMDAERLSVSGDGPLAPMAFEGRSVRALVMPMRR